MSIKDGKLTLFWRDKWLYNKPLKEIHPDLFSMCMQPNICVHNVKNDPNCITFTRWLVEEWRQKWNRVLLDLELIQLCEGADYVQWEFGKKRQFQC